MNIRPFCREECELERLSSVDGYGAPIFDAPETIACRKDNKLKQANKKRTQHLVDITSFLTIEEIQLGDRLDGEVIQAVATLKDIDPRRIVGYTSYPKPPINYTQT